MGGRGRKGEYWRKISDKDRDRVGFTHFSFLLTFFKDVSDISAALDEGFKLCERNGVCVKTKGFVRNERNRGRRRMLEGAWMCVWMCTYRERREICTHNDFTFFLFRIWFSIFALAS